MLLTIQELQLIRTVFTDVKTDSPMQETIENLIEKIDIAIEQKETKKKLIKIAKKENENLFEKILEKIFAFWGITREQLTSKNHSWRISDIRYSAIIILIENGFSQTEAALCFLRNHSNANYAIKRHNNLYRIDKKYTEIYDKIKNSLN